MPRKLRIDEQGRRRFIRTNPAARANSKRRLAYVTHGGQSALQHGPIDLRTSLGRQYKARLSELRSHLGVDLTPPQARLVDNAVRLSLLSDLSWSEITKSATGLIKDGVANPAIDIFLKACKHSKDTLVTLGLERRAKRVTLQDYLAGEPPEVYTHVTRAMEAVSLEDHDK